MLLNFLFFILRKFNKDFPSRIEVGWAADRCLHAKAIKETTEWYNLGLDIEDLAQVENITRERVRQRILKGVRKAHSVKNSKSG